MRENPPIREEYISLKEAAKISGYHQDYLSWLIRKGRIEGKRIGRDWFTTKKSLKTHLASKNFLVIKDFLFAKIKPGIIFISTLALILIGLVVFFISNPISYSRIPEDFRKNIELPEKSVEISQIKEVKIFNTYLSETIEEISSRLLNPETNYVSPF